MSVTPGAGPCKVPPVPNQHRNPTPEERDERVALPLDPEDAIRALLAVDPDAEPADDKDAPTE